MTRALSGSDDKFSRSIPANTRAYQEIDARKNFKSPMVMNGDNALTATPWARNEYGLTVGEPTTADALLKNLPDLMPTFLEGKPQVTGYYRSDEFYVYTPDGELENTLDVHNVYGPDGQTLLGKR